MFHDVGHEVMAKPCKYNQWNVVRPTNLWLVGCVFAYVVSVAFLREGLSQPVSSDPKKSTMRIEFKRSGGYAGIPLSATIDLDTLPAAESKYVRDLIDAAGFFALPAAITAPVPGADRFQYTLTIKTPERQHTVEIHEAAAPPALRPLLEWLTSAARLQRGQTSPDGPGK
jgi:hypothetical protein